MDIKPGHTVRIVTGPDPAKGKVFVKGSVAYDVREGTAILAQTDPPVSTSMLDKEIVVTYLIRKSDVMVRYGFRARIAEFVDHMLDSGRMAKALKVEMVGEAGPYSVRTSNRVAPMGQSDLSMAIRGTTIKVLDISLGGARFSYHKSLDLQPTAVVRASIEMDGRTYGLEARVLRTRDGIGEGFSHDLRFASVEFVNLDRAIEHALSRKIHDVQRESAQREKPAQSTR
jgi:hypothetical protein